MTQEEELALVRAYAAGKIGWRELQERGFDDYVQVLAGLGELGLRPPIAPPGGVNAEARERGRAMLERVLRSSA